MVLLAETMCQTKTPSILTPSLVCIYVQIPKALGTKHNQCYNSGGYTEVHQGIRFDSSFYDPMVDTVFYYCPLLIQ